MYLKILTLVYSTCSKKIFLPLKKPINKNFFSFFFKSGACFLFHVSRKPKTEILFKKKKNNLLRWHVSLWAQQFPLNSKFSPTKLVRFFYLFYQGMVGKTF